MVSPRLLTGRPIKLAYRSVRLAWRLAEASSPALLRPEFIKPRHGRAVAWLVAAPLRPAAPRARSPEPLCELHNIHCRPCITTITFLRYEAGAGAHAPRPTPLPPSRPSRPPSQTVFRNILGWSRTGRQAARRCPITTRRVFAKRGTPCAHRAERGLGASARISGVRSRAKLCRSSGGPGLAGGPARGLQPRGGVARRCTALRRRGVL